MAGLVCYYNSKKYYYLHITHDEMLGRVLDVSMCCNSWHSLYPMATPVLLPATGEVTLRAEVEFDKLVFSYATEGEITELPLELDYSILSDEVGDGGTDANFTGAFAGICCQDLANQSQYADFAYFEYEGS
jgi:xylan 1,4-beta-xylosidase